MEMEIKYKLNLDVMVSAVEKMVGTEDASRFQLLFCALNFMQVILDRCKGGVNCSCPKCKNIGSMVDTLLKDSEDFLYHVIGQSVEHGKLGDLRNLKIIKSLDIKGKTECGKQYS